MCVARYFPQHSDGRYLCYLWNKFKYLAMQISCHKDLIFKKCVFPKNCTFKQTVYVLYSWTCNKPLSTRNCGVTTWNRLTTLYRFLRIGFFLYKLYKDMYHFISQLRKMWHNPQLLLGVLELLLLLACEACWKT